MTPTHLEPESDTVASSAPAPQSPSASSSFSDAYNEELKQVEGELTEKPTQAVVDDYAMTFESDGEEHTQDNQDKPMANHEPETKSSPSSVTPVIVAQEPIHTPIDRPPIQSPSLPMKEQTTEIPAPAVHETDSTQNLTAESNTSKQQSPEDGTDNGIDIQQLLDNITANAEKNAASAAAGSSSHSSTPSLLNNISGLPSHSSLPPRPNVSQMPSLPDERLNFYAGAPGLPPASNSYKPPGGAASLNASFPSRHIDPRGGLPPPPSALSRGPPPTLPNINTQPMHVQHNPSPGQARLSQLGSPNEADDLDAKWGADVQKVYDDFLEDERHYVTEGLWDRFPMGSRLFIGNLPSESVTKRDLFHVFHHYGRIAQISIKQAYGFVQFHDSAACYAALGREQGTEVRGRKVHLEISKPQKNKAGAEQGVQPRGNRMSDGSRGGERGGQGRNNDRNNARQPAPMRNDEYGRPIRIRDDYRGRQSDPPRDNFRGRDEYTPRGRDSYDGRDRRRDRSRSPQYGAWREDSRYRERSLSPRAREAMEDESLQIPRRDPRNVPDVQIILMDQLDRQFVSWVETELRNRGIKAEVMFLSPRLPLEAVIRRQVLEGVLAVSKLDMRSQNTSQMPLRLFDRQAGGSSVQFDEYEDLEPRIAAELVLRAKQAQPQPQPLVQAPPPYAQPQFSSGQSYQPPAATPAPNLANLVGSLDNATLQKLLGTLNSPPQQQNAPAVAANSSIDLANLLGGLQSQQLPEAAPQAQSAPYSNGASNAAFAALLGGGQPQQHAVSPQGQQSAQQVQNIMAQLARFGGRQ